MTISTGRFHEIETDSCDLPVQNKTKLALGVAHRVLAVYTLLGITTNSRARRAVQTADVVENSLVVGLIQVLGQYSMCDAKSQLGFVLNR